MSKKHSTYWLSDEDYIFCYSRVPRFCVDLVIETKDGFLLSRRKTPPYSNMWTLPGGRIRFRERILKGIQRISGSEIGQDVLVGNFLGYMEFPRESCFGYAQHSVSLVFRCSLLHPITFFSDDDIRYFKKLPSLMVPAHKKFIKEIYLRNKY